MSAIVKEVYDAFREADVSEGKATEAAKAVAPSEHTFHVVAVSHSPRLPESFHMA